MHKNQRQRFMADFKKLLAKYQLPFGVFVGDDGGRFLQIGSAVNVPAAEIALQVVYEELDQFLTEEVVAAMRARIKALLNTNGDPYT
jgi:hypothetical protein